MPLKKIKASLLASTLLAASPVAAQQPATLTVDPSQTPEVLQVLDASGAWARIGTLDPASHIFSYDYSSLLSAGNSWTGGNAFGGHVSFDPAATLVASSLSVIDPPVGMKSGVDNNGLPIDNSPRLPSLMTANGPVGLSVRNSASGISAYFPGIPGQASTEYYFSNPLSWSRAGTIKCGGHGSWQGVSLVFAPGVNGVVEENATTSADGGWALGASVEGCAVISLGAGIGWMTDGGFSVTNALATAGPDMQQVGSIPVTQWEVGDGIIAAPWLGYPLANDIVSGSLLTVAYGTTVTAIDPNGKLTLSHAAAFLKGGSGAAPNDGKSWVYRLPVELAYNVTTTVGSNIVTTTGGSSIPLRPGDHIWSDAFPFGATVATASGPAGAQTMTIWDVCNCLSSFTASVTHAGGTGRMWLIPGGIVRRAQGYSRDNYIAEWPFGLNFACSTSGGCNGTVSLDEGNGFQSNLVGRMVAGNNSGGSTSHGNLYGHNHVADIIEATTIGSFYSGDSPNSPENYTSLWGIMGYCAGPGLSTFHGMYMPTFPVRPYCLPSGGALEAPPYPPSFYNNIVVFNPQNGSYPIDTVGLNGNTFRGDFEFSGPPLIARATSAVAVGVSVVPVDATVYGLSFVPDGSKITDTTTPDAIPANTTITSISGQNLTLSAPAAGLVGIKNGDILTVTNQVSPDGPCVGLEGGMASGSGLTISKDCVGTGFRLRYINPWGTWGWVPNGQTAPYLATFVASDYKGYAGTGSYGVVAPFGIEIGGQSPFPTLPGAERLLDFGSGIPTQATHLRGDVHLSNQPSPGGAMGWVETVDNSTTDWRPAGIIANEANGYSYNVGKPATYAVLNAALPCAAGSAGASATITDGVAAPAYLSAATGGGTFARPVFCDGAAWLYH